MIGKTILNYKILKSLDEGGMGAVFLAEHTFLKHQVVVKILLEKYLLNENVINRFIQEAKILTALNHPNIVRLVNFDKDPIHGYVILMDYVEGQTLGAFQHGFPNQQVPLETVLSLFFDLLDAFGHAHDKKIVHRDIKPNNILITPQGKPIILDFGIAKLKDSHLTLYSRMMGTPLYMSPEQILTPKDIDHRSDIYTLGVILYKMLTGKIPYQDTSSEFSLMREITERVLPSVTIMLPNLDAKWNEVIAKATAKKRTERYHDCAAFKTDLMQIWEMQLPKTKKEELIISEVAFRQRFDFKDARGGNVFDAYDTELNQTVAIKVIKTHYLDFDKFLPNSQLQHENIVQIKNYYKTDNGNFYIVMECYEYSLRDCIENDFWIIANGSGDYMQLHKKAIIGYILNGLAYLHNQGMIHGCLTPRNILVSKLHESTKRTAAISMYSESRLLKEDNPLDKAIFHPDPDYSDHYLSPEKIIQKPLRKNVDLWAVGVIIYEIIMGNKLFEISTTDPIQLYRKIMNDSFLPQVHQLPEPYKTMVLKCLKIDSAERVQSAEELLALLQTAEEYSYIKTRDDIHIPTPLKTEPKSWWQKLFFK